MNTSLLLSQILNGVVTGMLYALMGIGLSIITGILNIPNFAHGAMFAVGAYLVYTVLHVLGNFWLALLLAPLGVALLGLAIEYAGIRRLYTAGHDYQLLLTFGLSLIITEGIILVWGPVGMSQPPPPLLRGGVDLGIMIYPKYRLFVMVMAGLLVLAAWLFLEKTRYGAIMRAGIEDKEMVSLLGIDIHRLFTAAFALGAYLAGIAGALTAPIRGLNPLMGVDMLGIAFVVVALGGLGNLPGAIVAGLMIGVAQSLVALVWPEASVAVIFAVMAAVLLVRPQGLFGFADVSRTWLAVLAAVVVLPLIVRHAIATEIWIFAIFGLGLNLLLGYTGLLSFGQATFFGSAAYVGGYLLKQYGTNVFLVMALGTIVGAVSAAAVGYLCVQRSGLYFIMLTFALNQMFYFTAYQWTSVTGGEDGMPGVPRPRLFGVDLNDSLAYYAFAAALFLLSLWIMKRIVESPLGKILVAIRENELRAEALGYAASRFKLLAFVIGGAFSGLAGVLYAMLFGIVPLEAIGFVFSGNVVFATLIGGSGSLWGPVIGSFVFIWLSESVSVMWQRWPLLLGVAFVIVVLFFRGGVVEAWARFWAWRARRRAPLMAPGDA